MMRAEGPPGPPRGSTTPVGVVTVPTDEAFSPPKWKATVIEYVPGSCGALTVQTTLPSAGFPAAKPGFWLNIKKLVQHLFSPCARPSTHFLCSLPSPPHTFRRHAIYASPT